MADEWGTNSGGPGSDFVAKSATAAASLGVGLAAAQKKGGVLLKTLNDIMGPLALIQAAALGVALRFGNLVRESERVQRGLAAIAKVQLYGSQFKALLGGLDAANRKLSEIDRWTQKSPFEFDDAVTGARNLQTLTQGALATKAGMNLAGDAAADCGVSFGDMTGLVGGLYDALASGKPIGATAGALANLGVVSAGTVRQVESLNASGASLSTTWRLVEADLARSAGAMDAAAQRIAGLNSKLAGVRERQSQNTGASFEGGEKVRLEAELAAAEAMTPVLKSAGDVLGWFYAGWERAAGAVKVFAANFPGLRSGMASTIAAIGVMTVALAAWGVAVAVAQIAQMVTGLLTWAAASSAATTATGALARAILWLGNAAKVAVGPVGWLVTILGLLAFAVADSVLASNDFSKAQKTLKDAASETTRALKEQIANIQSMADRSAALLKAYQALAEAQERLSDAKIDQRRKGRDLNPFNDKPAGAAVEDAQKNVDAMQAAADETKAAALSTLSMDQERLDLAKQRLEIERQVREAAAEAAIQNLTGAAKQQALEARAAEKAAALKKADDEVMAFRSDEYAVADPRAKVQAAEATLAAKKKEIDELGNDGSAGALVKRAEAIKQETAAQAQRDAAQAEIDAYSPRSERFKAQRKVEEINRPGSTASGADRSAAQMELDRVIQQNDPGRAAGEKAAADAAVKQGQLDEAQRQAEATAGDQELARAREVAELRSEGVRRAREESEIRIKGLDDERARLEAQAAALKGGDTAAVARSGAQGKTPEQVKAELERNAIQRKGETDNRVQIDAEEKGAQRAAELAAKKESLNRAAVNLRDRDGSSAKGIEKDAAIAALQTRANDLDIADLQKKKAALATGDKAAIASAGATGMRSEDLDNSIRGKRTDNAAIAADFRGRMEDAARTKRYAQKESQAQRLEGGGNKEAAERKRDEIRLEERILELRRAGLKEEEATKEARKEQRQARRDRRGGSDAGGDPLTMEDFTDPGNRIKKRNREKGMAAIQSLQVDSMAGIGGNAGGGSGLQSLVRQILDEVRRSNGESSSSMPPPQWDDNNRPGPRPPF